MRDLRALAAGCGLRGRRVLITGGAGFIGSRLAAILAERNQVTVLDDLSNGPRSNLPEGVSHIDGDIRNTETISAVTKGVDVIFHEAALVDISQSISHPTVSHAVNTTATLELLEQARKVDARVVFASSAAIYGDPPSVPVAETAPKRPFSPYGIQKLAADHYLRTYDRLYGLPTVSLRYFNVYGRQRTRSEYSGVIQSFLKQARRGEPLTIYGDGTQTRDFVHVDDVVAANLLAATTDETGEAYNIGSGTAVSINELAALVREVTETSGGCVHESARDGDIDRSEADIRKARECLEYEPAVPLRDGLSSLLLQGEYPFTE